MEENRQADSNFSAQPAIDQQADPGEELRRYPQREDAHQIFIINV